MICVNSGREIIFAREEMIPWIHSPCKEFAPDRVKSVSDDEKYTGKCINLYLYHMFRTLDAGPCKFCKPYGLRINPLSPYMIIYL